MSLTTTGDTLIMSARCLYFILIQHIFIFESHMFLIFIIIIFFIFIFILLIFTLCPYQIPPSNPYSLQLMFAIITNTTWWRKLGEVRVAFCSFPHRFYVPLLCLVFMYSSLQIECLSLVIACLCHDLDHRGTNNR